MELTFRKGISRITYAPYAWTNRQRHKVIYATMERKVAIEAKPRYATTYGPITLTWGFVFEFSRDNGVVAQKTP